MGMRMANFCRILFVLVLNYLSFCSAQADTIFHAIAEDDLQAFKSKLRSGIEIEQLNRDCQTPLMVAVKFNRLIIARLLLDHGAHVNAADCVYKETPLHIA